ncbi:MAG: hypothetical protein IT303_12465 [Dehalococcoidia bacterium]|nr:hypothetical protein [Dehalococcoidia bacterium]
MEYWFAMAWLTLNTPFAIGAWLQSRGAHRVAWTMAAIAAGPLAAITQYFATKHRQLTRP